MAAEEVCTRTGQCFKSYVNVIFNMNNINININITIMNINICINININNNINIRTVNSVNSINLLLAILRQPR